MDGVLEHYHDARILMPIFLKHTQLDTVPSLGYCYPELTLNLE